MRKRFGECCVLVLMCVGLMISVVWADEFKSGDAIEVRQGTQWRSAKLISILGGRYRIEFTDGTRDWATPNTTRAPGRVPADSAGSSTTTKVDAQRDVATSIAPARVFEIGQQVEVQTVFNTWDPAQIMARRGELYLVATERFKNADNAWNWLTGYSIRKVGEDFPGLIRKYYFEVSKGGYSMRKSGILAQNKLKEFKAKHGSDLSLLIDTPENVLMAKERELQAKELLEAKREALLVKPDWFGLKEIPAPTQPQDLKPMTDLGEDFDVRSVRLSRFLCNTIHRETTISTSYRAGEYMMLTYGSVPGSIGEYVYLTNIRTGELIKSAEFHQNTQAAAISFDGTCVAALGDGKNRNDKDRIDLWDWSSTQPKHMFSFRPPLPESGYRSEDAYAAWTSNNLLLTRTREGDLYCWMIENNVPKALWLTKMGGHVTTPLLLANGTKVAVPYEKGLINIIDVASGEVDGTLDGRLDRSMPRIESICQSFDGRFLLAAGVMYVRMWDLHEGRAYRVMSNTGNVMVCNGGWILMDKKLVSGITGQSAWMYDYPIRLVKNNGLLIDSVFNRKVRNVYAWKLPHQSAINASTGLKTDILKFDRDEPIWINLDAMQVTSADKIIIKASISRALVQNGYRMSNVAVSQQLMVDTADQGQTQVKYSPAGTRDERNGTYQKKLFKLWMVKGSDKVCIGDSDYTPTGVVRLSEDEELQQAMDSYGIVKLLRINLGQIAGAFDTTAPAAGRSQLLEGRFVDQ